MYADPTKFSAPDGRGLVWDASGRSYIKIKNRYVPLILLDKGAERYHLVHKNANRPMMILRFHPESNQFRVETFLERKAWEAELKGAFTEIETNYHRTGGASQNVPLPRLDLSNRFSSIQEAMKLPTIPDRSAMWNTVRQAQVNPHALDVKRLSRIDPTVQPQSLTNFIPTRPIEVLPYSVANELNIKVSITSRDFSRVFTSPHQPKIDYQVIKGVDTRNSPEFIRPFQVELKKGLDKGSRGFLALKDRCRFLATVPDISPTREGQYLVKMFGLENVADKNQILQEINRRLLSISEQGEQILQRTKDIGFENIWIASTDLVLNPHTGKYESEFIKTVGVTALMKPADPQARIIFIADAFHLKPHPVFEHKPNIFKTVIHETTHLGAGTGDLVMYPIPRKGFEISGSELVMEYTRNLPQITQSDTFRYFTYRLGQQQNLPNLSPDTLARALGSDNMLRVNLQMEDAEMVAVIIRDLSEGRAFDFSKRIRRSLDEQPLKEQIATIFRNYVVSSLFNIDQYHLSPQLNRTQEQAELKMTKAELKMTKNVKNEEKNSILEVIAKGKEKINAIRSKNTKSSKLGELEII